MKKFKVIFSALSIMAIVACGSNDNNNSEVNPIDSIPMDTFQRQGPAAGMGVETDTSGSSQYDTTTTHVDTFNTPQ